MENETYKPVPENFPKAAISNMDEYHSMYNKSIQNNEEFWETQARKVLQWQHDFDSVSNCEFEEGMIAWFLGGKLNACENCVDRHAKTQGDKVALIWESDEPGVGKKITYKELLREVSKMANVLRHHGIRKGDRVALYMPMIPEAVYAMLACARIGAVHSVVFAGFSAEALRDRINDSKCKAVITANEGIRGKRIIPLKRIVDEAVMACPSVQHVFVAERTVNKVPFYEPRDVWLNDAMDAERPYCPTEHMDAEDTLFLLYTSGSTGKPKGLAHTTAGYLLYAALTQKYIFDYQPDDIFACVADIGWVTGHTYVVYGPLMNGGTTVIFESTPNYPDSGRYWEMVERLKITQFYTAPTAIRAIQRDGDEFVKKYDRSSLRVLGTVGEPINPDTWKWYYEVVGEGRCSIVDTWWQTETGGILIAPLPGATPTKPGSATLPFFGIEPVLLTPEGEEIEGNDVSGLLAIKKPWPSMARTIQGDHQRFLKTYLNDYKGYYLTGDGAHRDKDGYYWLTGRVDDVMNVSGHRIGSAEIEGALVSHPFCAEAAVVGFPHEIKGEGIFAYVLLREGYSYDEELIGELKNEVRHHIGPIATPDQIIIAPGLPKTRSGKIMRRILRKIAANKTEELGDTSTLADPSVVDSLIELRAKLE
ncbi:acetate--CoA ligase [Labilibacter marinus]|uniref:acetate--CoA ligase n=1 Tax=Labilibacter marinus TaxID=1477105 RepID=UPI00082BF13C|nr:acetate--CoA ligase [Labilibacter marinus]